MTIARIPSVSVTYPSTGKDQSPNELGMRPMQERAYDKRGEPYLLIKSPPASGKSRALMFIALDKLHNQGLKQAIITVPERSIGSSFNDEPLTEFGFWADWRVEPKWNLCNAPGSDGGKANAVGAFLASDDRVLVCAHATFRNAVEKYGIEAFDDRLIAVDEFHHVSAKRRIYRPKQMILMMMLFLLNSVWKLQLPASQSFATCDQVSKSARPRRLPIETSARTLRPLSQSSSRFRKS